MKNSDGPGPSIAPLFQSEFNSECTHLILTSSSDEGVIRNNGRNGTRYAPQAILSLLKKLNNHLPEKSAIAAIEVSDAKLEQQDFVKAQASSAEKISRFLQKFKQDKIIHLGGGHDHIAPLLDSLDQQGFSHLIVLNVDAHMDTRIEAAPNSGTPFRDFSARAKTSWQLYQYGIHDYANSKSTMTPFAAGNMTVIDSDQVQTGPKLDFIQVPSQGKIAWVFSLDVDALESSTFEAVSAVNHQGLPLGHVQELLKQFCAMAGKDQKIFGIYEYNPVYDNLSQKGARALAGLIYNFWKH